MHISCTRKIEFDAAHRVIGHSGKCHFFHGHRYVIEATFTAVAISEIGMIIDFGIIKTILGSWVEENWDHTAILNINDKEMGDKLTSITGQKIYYLKHNPTAENMALHLLQDVCPNLFNNKNVACTKIKLYETPNCYAEVVS